MTYTFDEYFAAVETSIAVRVTIASYLRPGEEHMYSSWKGEEGWHIPGDEKVYSYADLMGLIIPNQMIRKLEVPEVVDKSDWALFSQLQYDIIFGEGQKTQEQMIIAFETPAEHLKCIILQEDTAFYSLEGEAVIYPAGWVVYTGTYEWDTMRPDGYAVSSLIGFLIDHVILKR